jgi:hypothetical protein
MESCNCEGWKKGMSQIVGAQQLAAIHGENYTGAQFSFCPWCGRNLTPRAADSGERPANCDCISWIVLGRHDDWCPARRR